MSPEQLMACPRQATGNAAEVINKARAMNVHAVNARTGVCLKNAQKARGAALLWGGTPRWQT